MRHMPEAREVQDWIERATKPLREKVRELEKRVEELERKKEPNVEGKPAPGHEGSE